MQNHEHIEAETIPLSKNRMAGIDWLETAKQKLTIWAIGEIDVTIAREYLKTHFDENGSPFSFTSYLAYILGQAIKEHPHINAYLLPRRRKVVIFSDVDVACIVERTFDDNRRPIPVVYTIRAAQKKNWKEIHAEIREVKTRKTTGVTYNKKSEKQSWKVRMYSKFPRWFRRWFLRNQMKDPYKKKKYNGTIGLTSIGMFLEEAGNPIALTPHTLNLQVGGTEFQPRFNSIGELENREFLSVCFAIDHEVIDGGDAARFISTFRQMMKKGYGLNEKSTDKK